MNGRGKPSFARSPASEARLSAQWNPFWLASLQVSHRTICGVSFLIHETHRFCYNCNQQPYMGRSDFPSSPYNEIFWSEQKCYSSKTWLFPNCEKHFRERRPCVDPVFRILFYRLITTQGFLAWIRPCISTGHQPRYPIHCFWTAKEFLDQDTYCQAAYSKWVRSRSCTIIGLGFFLPWGDFQARWLFLDSMYNLC